MSGATIATVSSACGICNYVTSEALAIRYLRTPCRQYSIDPTRIGARDRLS